MKLTVLLLSMLVPASYAMAQTQEDDNNDHHYISFCNEQAEMAGIVDADEKKQYVNICLNNYGVTPAE